MSEGQRDLVASEGVDEGSAAMSAEGEGSGAEQTSSGGRRRDDDQVAAPDPVETPASRQAHDGQQLQAGEG